MAYVKGQGYVKTGYTPKQKEVAEWIVSGRRFGNPHIMLRQDKILRDYAVNPVAKVDSHWFPIIKFNLASSGVKDLGGGVVEVRGNAGAGGYTQIYKSRYGITIINTHRRGKRKKGTPKVITQN